MVGGQAHGTHRTEVSSAFVSSGAFSSTLDPARGRPLTAFAACVKSPITERR
jgi:hypothetical protein